MHRLMSSLIFSLYVNGIRKHLRGTRYPQSYSIPKTSPYNEWLQKRPYFSITFLDWIRIAMIEPVRDMPATSSQTAAQTEQAHPSVTQPTQAHSIDTASGKEAPAELSSSRVKKIFTDIAWDYERFNALSSFGQYISWLKKLIDASPITPTSRMLDIAGGTGDVTFMACKRKPPASIILSDYTPAMLDVAQKRLDDGEACEVPVELAVVDGQNIPYEDDSFDIVTMSYGIRNMPERERALSEMHRVLKPGGALCILEFSTPPNPVMRLGYNFYLRWGIPTWGKIVTGDSSGFTYLAKSIKAFPDQEHFSIMLKEAGFDRVDWTNVTFGVAAIHIAYKDR